MRKPPITGPSYSPCNPILSPAEAAEDAAEEACTMPDGVEAIRTGWDGTLDAEKAEATEDAAEDADRMPDGVEAG